MERKTDKEREQERQNLYKKMDEENKRNAKWANVIIASGILVILFSILAWILSGIPMPSW